MKKKIIKILLVIIWMLVIFFFSNEPATESSKLSNSFIKHTISKILHDDSSKTIEKYTKPVRKTAHFCVYLILGLLVLNCFDINKKYILYALLICFIYSISDEVHQFFISGRSCEVFDVFIDTFGSMIGITIEYKVRSNKSR